MAYGWSSDNPLLAGARESHWFGNPAVTAMVGALGAVTILILGQILGGTVAFLLAPLIGDPMLRLGIQLVFPFGAIFIVAALWLIVIERRPFASIGLRSRPVWRHYLVGWLLGVGFLAATVGLMAVFGVLRFATPSETAVVGLAALPLVVLIIPGWMIQGAAEELLTRGYIFQVFSARFAIWLGMVIQSIVFALIHLGNAGIGWVPVLNLLLVAVFLGLMVLREGGLWMAFGWHSAWNWAQGNLFGIAVSGNTLPASLLTFEGTGPELLGGGVFGAEGSLLASLVLLGGIAAFAVLLRRPGATA